MAGDCSRQPGGQRLDIWMQFERYVSERGDLMKLRVQCQAMQSTGPTDNVEGNIVHTQLVADLDPAETALVLVDTWGEHPIKSHYERTGMITETKIRPALDAARVAGITPIYAP